MFRGATGWHAGSRAGAARGGDRPGAGTSLRTGGDVHRCRPGHRAAGGAGERMKGKVDSPDPQTTCPPPGTMVESGEVPALTEDATAIVALAAHELKNALGGIGVALARCEQRLQAGKPITSDDLGIARAEVRRLSALVNDLLDGACVDLGEMHIQTASVDLTALTREVVDMFA